METFSPSPVALPVAQRLRDAEDFFVKRGPVHTTLERLARRLDEEGIPYAVVGGMALNLHNYERMTRDVDVLVTRAGIEKFVERCVGRGYIGTFSGARKALRDTATQVPIKFILTGEYPGDGKPKPVAFPDPATASIEMEGIRVITLEKLIELNLASGLSAPYRLNDLADVQRLIIILRLPADFAERLDQSVRAEFGRLWEAAQGADEEA